MKKIFLLFLVLIVIFLVACTPKQPAPSPTPSVCNEGDQKYEACNQCSCDNGQWTCTEIACVACSGTWVNGQCITQETQEMPEPEPMQEVKEFTVEGDDLGLYPDTITVNNGDLVKITFKVREEKVYYGGLDFRSENDYFDTGKVLPGGIETVEFTADESFSYTSYWPSSGVEKATGQIIVN